MGALKRQQKFIIRKKKDGWRWCLQSLEIDYHKRIKQRSHGRFTGIAHLTFTELWDLHDEARINFKRLVRQHHPDKGGDPAICGQLTTNWKYLKSYFKSKGIS